MKKGEIILSYGFKIMVAGDYACFTRPELQRVRKSELRCADPGGT